MTGTYQQSSHSYFVEIPRGEGPKNILLFTPEVEAIPSLPLKKTCKISLNMCLNFRTFFDGWDKLYALKFPTSNVRMKIKTSCDFSKVFLRKQTKKEGQSSGSKVQEGWLYSNSRRRFSPHGSEKINRSKITQGISSKEHGSPKR